MTDTTQDPGLEGEDANNEGAAKPSGDLAKELETIKSELDKAKGEAAKQKSLAKQAIAERDALKTSTKVDPDKEESWQTVFKQQQAEINALKERDKNNAIGNAVRDELVKAGVTTKKLNTAMKLFETSMVEYDPKKGVDADTVTAGLQKLRADADFLFEEPVSTTTVKPAADGSPKGKTITKAEFERLTPQQKMDKMVKEKYRVVD